MKRSAQCLPKSRRRVYIGLDEIKVYNLASSLFHVVAFAVGGVITIFDIAVVI